MFLEVKIDAKSTNLACKALKMMLEFRPFAEVFFCKFGWKTLLTFYPERGSPTKIWKYIIAKGVRGLSLEAEAFV